MHARSSLCALALYRPKRWHGAQQDIGSSVCVSPEAIARSSACRLNAMRRPSSRMIRAQHVPCAPFDTASNFYTEPSMFHLPMYRPKPKQGAQRCLRMLFAAPSHRTELSCPLTLTRRSKRLYGVWNCPRPTQEAFFWYG